MNDIELSWKKISRGIARVRQSANDRAPTREVILRLLEYPNRRIRPILYTMISSGIRFDAWDYFKWKHVRPISNEKGVMAAKLTVYADEYYSFITPEAYKSLKDWMGFREIYGDSITRESRVMHDLWQTTNISYGAKLGLATYPRKLKSSGIKRLLEHALWEQGLRRPLPPGVRRHDWKAADGFRKFYKRRTHILRTTKQNV